MKYPYILVVTYGRSGSTLLQGVLNSIDGCLIAGENFNFIFPLYQSYRRLLSANTHVAEGVLGSENPHLPRHPFFGARRLSPELFLEDASRLVIAQLRALDESKGTRCLGFKEIRYAEALPELEEYLDFLHRILPGSALIFNTRRSEEVARSAWLKKQRRRDVLSRIQRLDMLFRAYADKSLNAFVIDYSDCVRKTERLKDLLQFLGAEYSEARIDAVLNTPPQFFSRPRGRATSPGSRNG
ncbi:sulfotransferase [Methyloterricola oryzae]|uniref:sulfotransferase n=1 Tax=Methyloterricola oryzae TaxID=1495050 RepID=UPI0005EAF26A|nr:sulfotransferase [Methyloterricola oryzae]